MHDSKTVLFRYIVEEYQVRLEATASCQVHRSMYESALRAVQHQPLSGQVVPISSLLLSASSVPTVREYRAKSNGRL
jgi:hypothetical protein